MGFVLFTDYKMNISLFWEKIKFAELYKEIRASQVVLAVKYLSAKAGDTRDTGAISELEDPWEEEMAIHSSILA